jgi:hypothetical protein
MAFGAFIPRRGRGLSRTAVFDTLSRSRRPVCRQLPQRIFSTWRTFPLPLRSIGKGTLRSVLPREANLCLTTFLSCRPSLSFRRRRNLCPAANPFPRRPGFPPRPGFPHGDPSSLKDNCFAIVFMSAQAAPLGVTTCMDDTNIRRVWLCACPKVSPVRNSSGHVTATTECCLWWRTFPPPMRSISKGHRTKAHRATHSAVMPSQEMALASCKRCKSAYGTHDTSIIDNSV